MIKTKITFTSFKPHQKLSVVFNIHNILVQIVYICRFWSLNLNISTLLSFIFIRKVTYLKFKAYGTIKLELK